MRKKNVIEVILKSKSIKLTPYWINPRKINKKELFLRYLIKTNLTHYKYRIKHSNPKLFELPF